MVLIVFYLAQFGQVSPFHRTHCWRAFSDGHGTRIVHVVRIGVVDVVKTADLVSSLVLIGLTAVAVWEAVQLPFGTLRSPEAGFWPLILAMILGIFSFVRLGKTLKEKVEEAKTSPAFSGGWRKIVLVVTSLVAFAFVFERLGYLISIFLLMAFLLRTVKPMRWWLVIVIALSSSVLSYLVFGVLLSTPLPGGLIQTK